MISKEISKAVEILNNEELVAIPTETVYGLAANIFSEKAVKKILEMKKRPLFNPLIVHRVNSITWLTIFLQKRSYWLIIFGRDL